MQGNSDTRVAVIGGGPAGLMAAERLCLRGFAVDLYDAKASVGRKFLIAGKGGLNLTHGEPFDRFVERFGDRAREVERWLRVFGPDQLRDWARGFGIDTFVGSSGRVFPTDLKAAPLLRGWLRRLRADGVQFHVQHRWLGWDAQRRLRLATPAGETFHPSAVTVLALGGGSWARLGSDGAWVAALADHGVDVAPLQPSNCGFEAQWSEHFVERQAGQPLKPVQVSFIDAGGRRQSQRGEMLVTRHGLEGSLVYALSSALRDTLALRGCVVIEVDLCPELGVDDLAKRLAAPIGKRSLSEHLRRRAGLCGTRAALLREAHGAAMPRAPHALAAAIKSVPVTLHGTRPLDEAISSAGGVRLAGLDARLMIRSLPGVFCCGEMLDWEAPTGGYLLTACMASGRIAGDGAADWLLEHGASVT